MYAVETRFGEDSWEVCWAEEDVAMTFDDKDDALQELNTHRKDTIEGFNAGYFPDDFVLEDYRIINIDTQEVLPVILQGDALVFDSPGRRPGI